MKKRVDIIINIFIIILELYAVSRMIIREGVIDLEYYTVLSNILALFTCITYLGFYGKNTDLINKLYFMVTCMMTLTFLIVFFVLVPMYNFDYYWLMCKGSNLMMHTLCPILMIISYTFNNKKEVNKYLPLIPTVIYGIIMLGFNITKTLDGPYPFLRVYNQSILMTILWIIILLIINYLISLGIIKLNRKLGVKDEYKNRESRRK